MECNDRWNCMSFLVEEKLLMPMTLSGAIAIKKATLTENVIVGHTPRVISSVCSVFIHQGGTIVCVVNGARQYLSDLPWHLLTMAHSHSKIHWNRVTPISLS